MLKVSAMNLVTLNISVNLIALFKKVMIMNTKYGFPAVSVTVLLMTLHSSQIPMHSSQATSWESLPASVDVQISGNVVKEPLLLAGNTACNPRVTVCEE